MCLLHESVCVCACVCVYVCVCVHTSISVGGCMCLLHEKERESVCVCACICVRVCVRACIHICGWVYVFVAWERERECVCVCTSISVHFKDRTAALLQELANKFCEQGVSLEDFLARYIPIRTVAHKRRIKTEKMGELLREGRETLSSWPPQVHSGPSTVPPYPMGPTVGAVPYPVGAGFGMPQPSLYRPWCDLWSVAPSVASLPVKDINSAFGSCGTCRKRLQCHVLEHRDFWGRVSCLSFPVRHARVVFSFRQTLWGGLLALSSCTCKANCPVQVVV